MQFNALYFLLEPSCGPHRPTALQYLYIKWVVVTFRIALDPNWSSSADFNADNLQRYVTESNTHLNGVKTNVQFNALYLLLEPSCVHRRPTALHYLYIKWVIETFRIHSDPNWLNSAKMKADNWHRCVHTVTNMIHTIWKCYFPL